MDKIIIIAILILICAFVVVILPISGKKEIKKPKLKKELKFQEMVDEIYELLKGNRIKKFKTIRNTINSSTYKKILKHEETGISIALHNEGSLFISFNNSDEQKEFLENNNKGGWEKTETYSSGSIYNVDDLDVLSRPPEKVLDTMKEYAEIIKETF